jgi:hypothetical protein
MDKDAKLLNFGSYYAKEIFDQCDASVYQLSDRGIEELVFWKLRNLIGTDSTKEELAAVRAAFEQLLRDHALPVDAPRRHGAERMYHSPKKGI